MSIENPKQLSKEQKVEIKAAIEGIKSNIGQRERQALEYLVELKPLLEEFRDFVEIPDNDECWGFPTIDQILVWIEECKRGRLNDARIGNVYVYITDTLNFIVENY
jgi:hypothetical protein